MPDTSATPKLQATADLSPLSPSPLHSAPAVALPALQDTADILDAMMEMPANNETHLGPGAGVAGRTYTQINPGQGIAMAARPTVTLGKGEGGGQDARDSDNDFDSLGDPYAEDQETSNNLQPQPEEPNTAEDDYLKSFDSPIQNEQDESAAANDVSQDSRPHRPPPPEQVEHAALAQSSDRAYQHGQPQSSLHASTIPGKSDDHADDISRLVAEMTGQAAEEGPHDQYNTGPPPAQSQQPRPSAQAAVPPVSSVPSLPARPPMPQPVHSASKFASASMFPHESHAHQQPLPAPPAYAAPVVPALPNVQPLSSAPLTPGQPSTYVAAGARGSLSEGASLPHTPVVPIQSMTAPPYPDPSGFVVRQPANDAANRETLWERFNADERRYMSEAKWDRFPEGSRIFIGNLSSERVSKRDVFDIFHQYGQLAQISLKSAYGFVQYHTVEDAQAVMQNLQGIEIKGRKIHLEICRTQKKKGNDRGRSRSPNRGSRGSRDGAQRRDRFDDGPGRRQRDEQPQHARGASPRRADGEMYGRDRGYYEAHPQPRERSRSPPPHGRPQDPYRRRSPSPAHPHPYEDRLEIPRRYGPQVPDVQFLLLEEVGREFVDWVQRAFLDRGLKVDVMFLNRGFPRAAVLQRQVMEGVHGIVDLDMRAHAYGKISLQVFDRSTGGNARFDQYQDLDPPIAAELVLRAKSQAVPTQPYNGNSTSNGSHHYPPQPAYPVGDYGQRHHQPYAPPPPPHAQVSPHSPSFPVGHGPQGRPMYPPHQGPPDLAGVPGQLDGPGLHRFLASVQNQQSVQGAGGQLGHPAEQIDIQALLAGLKGGPVGGTQPGPYGGQGYPTAGPPHNNGRPGPHHYDMNMGSPDSTSQVNTIMAQLARFRQP